MADNAVAIQLENASDFRFRLNKLRQEDRRCDVRFEINGTIFPCHQVILIAASPYFDAMFNGNFEESHSSDIIPLKEIDQEVFEIFLNALYTGIIHLRRSNVYLILKISNYFQVNSIENACVKFMSENLAGIPNLVEVCVSLEKIHEILYSKCAKFIACRLDSFSKTEALMKVPLNIFEFILKNSHFQELPVILIFKWIEKNPDRRDDAQTLLAPFLSADIKSADAISGKTNFPLNFYVNLTDVETSQRGWGVLKIDNEWSSYVLSSFHPSNSYYKTVCEVGSKMYCLEYFSTNDEFVIKMASSKDWVGVDEKYKNDGGDEDEDEDRERGWVFSCYEGNKRTLLPTPPNFDRDQEFQIATMGCTLYFMEFHWTGKNERFVVWMYNCISKTWTNVIKADDYKEIYSCVEAFTFLNGFFYIMGEVEEDGEKYLFKINSTNLVIEKIIESNLNFCSGYTISLYGFENKLVHCGLEEDEDDNATKGISIFDLEKKQWLEDECDDHNEDDIPAMEKKNLLENFFLTHNEEFVYVVNNKWPIKGEKYNIEAGTWSTLPKIPILVELLSGDGAIKKMAIRNAFGASSISEA